MELAIIVIFLLALGLQEYQHTKHLKALEATLQGDNVLPPAITEKAVAKEQEEVDPIMDLEDAIANADVLKNILDNHEITQEGINPLNTI